MLARPPDDQLGLASGLISGLVSTDGDESGETGASVVPALDPEPPQAAMSRLAASARAVSRRGI
jgi:hypothetical protein